MGQNWQDAFSRALLIFAATAVIGWFFDQLVMALLITTAAYLATTWRQMTRLMKWLAHAQDREIPDASGFWGEIFDGIYRLQKDNIEAQARFKTIINRIQDSTSSLRDGVIMVDADGTLEWWNQAAEKLIGLRAPLDLDQPITNLIRHPAFKLYFEQSEYGEPLEIPSPINPDVIIEVQCNLFSKNDRLIVVRDISRVKYLEAMRTDFVANVSHELRTPLTVIYGYLETLESMQDMLPPALQRSIKQMHNQTTRMQNLVTDLLALSQLETSESLDQKPVHLASLIRDIKNDATAVDTETHQIHLDLDENISIQGKETEIASAISNLVVNAIKYTPSGCNVFIRSYRDELGHVRVDIKDEGPGIDPQHIPRLTERFYRVDSGRHNETGGTGLGLAIVKHVLLRHQGQLEISSVLGKGSTFSCVFKQPETTLLVQADEAS